jgi:hypothetical protein
MSLLALLSQTVGQQIESRNIPHITAENDVSLPGRKQYSEVAKLG